MKIQPIAHQTLSETAAGKLAASILDGSLPPGTQLPPERELMNSTQDQPLDAAGGTQNPRKE